MSWTHAKNSRRCDLIDREIDGTITQEEQAELDRLQNELVEYRHTIDPSAEALHRNLELLQALGLENEGKIDGN